ncbi:RNase H domain-containing protein [Trichonephila clavipes]|nr:RNase H domain-containing protein [Trichonephila clavipes]
MALGTIHGIPHSVLKIPDRSMGDGGISGSDVYIETSDGTFDINIRNNKWCYVFRDIWILTDSQASIQHLSHWTTVGDMTSLNLLDLVVRLSSRHSIYFQCVHSHFELNGNEIADILAKSATADTLKGKACLTFTELCSIKRMELNALWRVSPSHPWYFGNRPSWCHQLNTPRNQQTALFRFF